MHKKIGNKPSTEFLLVYESKLSKKSRSSSFARFWFCFFFFSRFSLCLHIHFSFISFKVKQVKYVFKFIWIDTFDANRSGAISILHYFAEEKKTLETHSSMLWYSDVGNTIEIYQHIQLTLDWISSCFLLFWKINCILMVRYRCAYRLVACTHSVLVNIHEAKQSESELNRTKTQAISFLFEIHFGIIVNVFDF